ncbi:MAG: BlaI/MecI/CopY family transcriptional regulator [Vicinamibacteria bacterium]
MKDDPHAGLSARERETLEIVIRLGRATATQVEGEMADAPSNATVRSTLRILERKGWVTHHRDGARYVYRATHNGDGMRKKAARHFVRTFFGGSVADAMAALLDGRSRSLSERDQRKLEEILRRMDEGGE